MRSCRRTRDHVGQGRPTSIGPHRPQAHAYDRLRLRRCVRLQLLCSAEYETAGIDLCRRGAIGAADQDNVRTRRDADRPIPLPPAALHRLFPRLSARLGHCRRSITVHCDGTASLPSLRAFRIALYILGCAVIGIAATALLTDYTNKDISEEYDKNPPCSPFITTALFATIQSSFPDRPLFPRSRGDRSRLSVAVDRLHEQRRLTRTRRRLRRHDSAGTT